jgi:dienelactone hydrolase
MLDAPMKVLFGLLALTAVVHAATLPERWQVPDESLASYFARKTKELAEKSPRSVSGATEWERTRPVLQAQLAEMLGLAPMPTRSELRATTTKRIEHEFCAIENLHFQSMPGLYVTANLYVPKGQSAPAPAVLYVCGHSPVVTNGISYGNKTAYQHHGLWFARNGYVCLVIDTVQLGEIAGTHHGTYREGMWWWNARGYTPAGVEAWNGIRALDYLATRAEVDTKRLGVTGRSGGGAYSWFIAALDERVKVAAPVAGITDLHNHVADGAVEGHCDCMYFVNTFRWDYSQLAALAAPRPLLVCNTDDDSIFPLDGVVRTWTKVRRVYDTLGAGEKFGLVITPGGHKDTQELQLPVMRWFNRHLKGEETPVTNAAVKLLAASELKVFSELPPDSLNARIHESFVPAARAELPASAEQWPALRRQWQKGLREKVFAAFPEHVEAARFAHEDLGTNARGRLEVESEPGVTNIVQYLQPRSGKPTRVVLHLLNPDVDPFGPWAGNDTNALYLRLATRGTGRQQWAGDAAKQVQLRRRFMLLGETVHSARVWDIMRTVQAVRASAWRRLPLRLEASGEMAVNALYASLFTRVDELVLERLPSSHMRGPDYLNVLRVLDVPQALALAADRSRVELRGADAAEWTFTIEAARNAGFEKNLILAGEAR